MQSVNIFESKNNSSSSYYLSNTLYVLGRMPSTLYSLFHLNLSIMSHIILCLYESPYFIGKAKQPAQDHIQVKWQAVEHRSDSKVCVLNHCATELSSHIKIFLSFSLIHILLTFPGYINQCYPEKQIYTHEEI